MYICHHRVPPFLLLSFLAYFPILKIKWRLLGYLGRSEWTRGLRLLQRWDRGFESHSRYGCLCAFILCMCCCVCRQRPSDWLITSPRSPPVCVNRDYEIEEVRAQQRAVEQLMNECKNLSLPWCFCVCVSSLKSHWWSQKRLFIGNGSVNNRNSRRTAGRRVLMRAMSYQILNM
jgi:hypothetical protein